MSQVQLEEQIQTMEADSGISQIPLPSPNALKSKYPLGTELVSQVARQREDIQKIVRGEDKRLLVITGPCSLHCHDSALDYAKRLAVLADKYSDKLMIVMRAYLEKPRTSVGWKGMLYDPHMDGSNDIGAGIEVSRKLLVELASLGLPLATEALNPLAISYLDDVLSWVAIGARTTESQTHREMASALPCPVGFKNGTDGGLEVAINALVSAAHSHSYFSMCQDGLIHSVRSAGNAYGQLVLRGGKHGPNYDAVHLAQAKKLMRAADLTPSVVVDCSHENSAKDHSRQSAVIADVLEQRRAGCDVIKGVMLESHIEEGRQGVSTNMQYGKSVTDACIGWGETADLLQLLSASL